MSRTGTLIRRSFAAVICASALTLSTSILATASTKPVRELVPRGATVLVWRSPSTIVSGTNPGSRTVLRNLATLARIRALINDLPVTSSAPRVCPDDLMIPTTLSFYKRAGAAPFTTVMFQLGGCPYARVYQHGVAVSPTLGGENLASIYARIERIVRATA